MPHLVLRLLGSFQVILADQPIPHFRAVKNQALLAYLALAADRAHARSALAGLLWPEEPEERARLNLRQALFQLRNLLQPAAAQPAAEFLVITGQSVQFALQSPHWIDVTAFCQQLAAVGRHDHAEITTCSHCLAQLAQAVPLYQHDFLHDLPITDSPPLEEWRTWQRQRLQDQLFFALQTLTQAHEAQGDWAAMYHYVQRQLEIDPLREEGHRQLMRTLARRGQIDEALAHYERCRRLFKKELDAPLDAKTKELYQQIKQGHFPPPAPIPRPLRLVQESIAYSAPSTGSGAEHPAWSEAPETGPIYGRQREAAQLTSWLGQEHCQLIALLGMGGMGKTTLAASVARNTASQFATICWFSLLNAPPPDELLRRLLQRLNGADNPPPILDEQLALLLTHLRQQRCLVVLDNFESILDNATPGQMRDGYGGYARLLACLVENRHNSCLLLTSRELPQPLERWAADLPWVHSLRLDGLDTAAGHKLLSARGLPGQPADAHRLIQRYSGNPLALKLVAQTITDLFAGAIAEFLREETPFFDDIRTVLDQQFARLTTLEQELLTWLAIEREPVSSPALRQKLVSKPTTAAFLEAMRALQRRSLLEVVDTRFTLQNVLIEYVTERLVAQIVGELVKADKGTGSSTEPLTLSPTHLVTRSWLNRYPLLQAQAKEYVRQSQARLIVQPVAERLVARVGLAAVPSRFQAILAQLRAAGRQLPGYAAGNLFNLLRALGLELAGYDFSQLAVWQADLRGVATVSLNLTAADLRHCAFTLNFTTYAVRFNPAGQVLIAGIATAGISLWVAEEGQLYAAFSRPSHGAYPIVFSDNGELMAAGALDHAVQLWSTADGARLHTLVGQQAKIAALCIHTRRQRLASGSVDGTIRLWAIGSGAALHTLLGHSGEVGALAFAADGSLLASGSADQTIRLWDPHGGQLLTVLAGHTSGVTALAFSPDGRWLVSGGDDSTLRLWAIPAALTPATTSDCCHAVVYGHTSRIRVLAFDPTGQWIASGSSDRTIRLWTISANQSETFLSATHVLSGHAYEVASLAFADDGTRLVSGGAERMVRLWETQTGQALGVLHGYATVLHSVRFSPAGAWIASGGADGILRLWGAQPHQSAADSYGLLRYCEGHSAQIFAVAFSPDGSLVASGSGDQTIRLWTVPTGQLVTVLRGHNNYVTSVAFSPDGQWLASGGADGTLRLWSVAALAASETHRDSQAHSVLRVGEASGVSALVFSPAGQTLFCGYQQQLYAVPLSELTSTLAVTKQPPAEIRLTLRPWHGHTARVNRLDVSPDGRWVASIGMDYTVRLWDAATGACVATRSGQGTGNSVVAFDPSGQWLAYNVEEMAIALADARTLDVIQILRGHSSTVLALHFHHQDGRTHLVSCGWDGTMRLWEVGSGRCLQTLSIPGPYTGMKIHNATGISAAQKAALMALGATA